jgi:hypothetical protein
MKLKCRSKKREEEKLEYNIDAIHFKKSQPTKCTIFCLKYLYYNTQSSSLFQSSRD